MPYPKAELAQTLTLLLKKKAIQHIVISPGSRNGPLTLGFTAQPYFKCYSIVDERCAAFFALGMAQQHKHAVALVCTSGSALLNYYPAVAEAFYSHIPLLILSADRPKYLVNIGDGQTINQNEVFGKHVLHSANLKQDIDRQNDNDVEDIPLFKTMENKLEKFLGLQQNIQQYNESEINKTINICINKSGPVHINCPFEEPLYECIDNPVVKPISTNIAKEISKNIDSEAIKTCIRDWTCASKKIILVGVNTSKDFIQNKWLDILATDDSVLLFTETTSNLHHDTFFSSIDKFITPLQDHELKDLKPEILLTIGGMLVSKKIKAFLRAHKPKQHWHVGMHKANDTFFILNKHIKSNPDLFFSILLANYKVTTSNYKPFWNAIMQHRRVKHNKYLNQITFSDLSVFNTILKVIPKHSHLQLGNSTTIRYTQLFDLNPNIMVYCNRGTSGIDGSTSTAIGSAVASNKLTTLITGDLSFFYDSNALWNVYIPKHFKIIVINNNGGGIFRILPGYKNNKNFDRFFETKHKYTCKHLCEMYNFEYYKATNNKELDEALHDFYITNNKPKLLEITTSSKHSAHVLLDYFEYLK